VAKKIEFNFKANYPLPENQEEFNQRAASAIARVLIQTYPPEVIDEIIDTYKRKKAKQEDK